MGKKRVMVPVQEVDMSAVKYEQKDIEGYFRICIYTAGLL